MHTYVFVSCKSVSCVRVGSLENNTQVKVLIQITIRTTQDAMVVAPTVYDIVFIVTCTVSVFAVTCTVQNVHCHRYSKLCLL